MFLIIIIYTGLELFILTLSALRLASFACCSQASALSMALSFSSFMACIFFLMASIVQELCLRAVRSLTRLKSELEKGGKQSIWGKLLSGWSSILTPKFRQTKWQKWIQDYFHLKFKIWEGNYTFPWIWNDANILFYILSPPQEFLSATFTLLITRHFSFERGCEFQTYSKLIVAQLIRIQQKKKIPKVFWVRNGVHRWSKKCCA